MIRFFVILTKLFLPVFKITHLHVVIKTFMIQSMLTLYSSILPRFSWLNTIVANPLHFKQHFKRRFSSLVIFHVRIRKLAPIIRLDMMQLVFCITPVFRRIFILSLSYINNTKFFLDPLIYKGLRGFYHILVDA